MNLADARALTKALIYSTGWKAPDDYVIDKIISVCNDFWWKEIVRGITSLCMKDSPDLTATAGTYDYSGTLLDPAGVFQLVKVECKYLGRYIDLKYEVPPDRYIYNIAFGQVQALIPSAYTLMGEKVVLLPYISGNAIIRITYVPNAPDPVQDSDTLLNGIVPAFHDIVCHDAASKLVPAGMNQNLKEDVVEHRRQLADFMVSRQRADGRQIRFVPYE